MTPPAGYRVVQLIVMKRNHVRLTGPDKYGHWWFEIGDPLDPTSESYGWWPAQPITSGAVSQLVQTLTSVPGAERRTGILAAGRSDPRPASRRQSRGVVPTARPGFGPTNRGRNRRVPAGVRTRVCGDVRRAVAVAVRHGAELPDVSRRCHAALRPVATGADTMTTWTACGVRYYRTFASYAIPFRPVDELAFADTEGLAAYSVAYHDDADRVVRFAKIQLVRPSKDTRPVPLADAREPGTRVYFAPDSTEPIEYADTADLPAYDVGTVDSSGRSAAVVRIEKRIAVRDVYAYWPDGTLRERRTEGGGRSAVEYYDRSGARTDVAPPDDAPLREPPRRS